MKKKNLLLILISLLSLFSVSCKEDDDSKVDNRMVGTWWDNDTYDGFWQWVFNADGKGTLNVESPLRSYTIPFDYSFFDNNILSISGVEDGKQYIDNYNVSFSSDGKKMMWSDMDKDYKIILSKDKPDYNLKLSDTSLEFTNLGGKQTFKVMVPVQVQVSSDQDWCIVTTYAKSNETLVTVSVQPNAITVDRAATITVTAGNQQATVNVMQAAADWLEVPNQQFSVSAGEETITINYRASTNVDVQSSVSWIHLLSNNSVRTEENGKIFVTGSTVLDVDINIGSERQGTATLTLGSIVVTVTITQAAGYVTPNSATGLAKRLGWGWNLGNHFDTSSGEDGKHPQWGYWDNATPTQQLYTNLKKTGVSTVRIGVTWGNYQSGDDWTIESAYMAEVKQNVEWAGQAGLNVILNMHHDEYWLDVKTAATNSIVNNTIKTRISKTWTQIAEAFKDQGDYLFFETFNEVQDGQWGWGANRTDGGKQYKTLNEWNQTAVDAIRATGGQNATRWIGIPGYANSPSFVLINEFQLPTDAANRLMVSVHFYDPNTFTLTPESNGGKSEWGHTAAAGKFQAGSNEEHVVETFQQLYAKFVANNIPVYIGEYGCVMHKNSRSNLFRNYYLEYVCRAAHAYNLPLCIWDNNAQGGGDEHHGYINHTDGSFLNNMSSIVAKMINAATSDDADYTLESIYDRAPK